MRLPQSSSVPALPGASRRTAARRAGPRKFRVRPSPRRAAMARMASNRCSPAAARGSMCTITSAGTISPTRCSTASEMACTCSKLAERGTLMVTSTKCWFPARRTRTRSVESTPSSPCDRVRDALLQARQAPRPAARPACAFRDASPPRSRWPRRQARRWDRHSAAR